MKNRIIGLDILRILSMIGIVGLHVMNNGGLLNATNINSFRYILYLIIISIFYTSVNIFGILSGYLNINKKKNNNKRIVELLTIMFFYSIVITVIFFIFNLYNYRETSFINMLFAIFPPLDGGYWYVTCYFFIFFMFPYLNIFLNRLSKKNYQQLLFILFILLSVLPTTLFHTDFFRTQFGYSPFWLIFLYMIGGYFKKYKLSLDSKTLCLLLLINISYCCIYNYYSNIIHLNTYFSNLTDSWFIDYISPFTFFNSISLFLLISKINCNNKIINKILTSLSNSAFSVYIIHSHGCIYNLVLKNYFIPLVNYRIIISCPLILLSCIAIYIICYLIDLFRIQFFSIIKYKFRIIPFVNKKQNT